MSTYKAQALLFDLGGVVIDIDFNRAFEHWQPISCLSLEEMKSAFKFDLPYQRHERGEIDANEYFDHLSASLQLDHDYARIAMGWNSIFVGEISETRCLVQAARAKFPCYAFTNSNVTHQIAWSQKFPLVVEAFDEVFVSSSIGLRKPERQAFEHVANTLGVPVASIVFFDDLIENVAGAAMAGLDVVHVTCPADVRAALKRLGCQV